MKLDTRIRYMGSYISFLLGKLILGEYAIVKYRHKDSTYTVSSSPVYVKGIIDELIREDDAWEQIYWWSTE